MTSTTFLSIVSTSTIPASSGFLPIQSTLPNSSFDGLIGGPDPISKRGDVSVEARTDPDTLIYHGEQLFLQSVSCLQRSAGEASTTTRDSHLTIFASPSCATISPLPAVFSFTTTIVTSTSTVVTSTTSVYAACATNNFADRIQRPDGSYLLIDGGTNFYAGVATEDAASGYDCCVDALTYDEPTSQGDIYGGVFEFDPGSNTCYIPGTYTCMNQSQALFEALTGPSAPVILGNGYCGEVRCSWPGSTC